MISGLSTPDVPAFNGVEHLDIYDDMSVDPEDFKDKSILIVGKGNAGMETAANLLDVANYIHITSRSPVRLAIATHYVGDVRLSGRAGSVIEGYQLKSMNGFYDTNWAHIMDKVEFQKSLEDGRIRLVPLEGGLANKTAVRKYVYPLNRAYDSVLVCTGWKFDRSMFGDNVTPEMTGADANKALMRRDLTGMTSNDLKFKQKSKKYPALDGAYRSVNIPNLYFAGTIAHGKDWRKAAGGFIHGFRYTTQALHRVLEHRIEGVDWPADTVAIKTPTGMKSSLISPLLPLLQIVKQRVNEASSYYQMFGQLWDVIAFDPNDMSTATYYYDVPKDYIHGDLIPDSCFTVEISYEYGATHPDCPGVSPGYHREPEGAMCASASARDIFKSARTPFSGPGWMGVSEFLHPVFKLHYPKDSMP